MTHQIYPCFWFDDNAKEAATFYCSVFEQSSIISENPVVVMFQLGNKKIMALNGGPMFKVNPSISLFVRFSSIDKTKEVWDKLMDSGNVLMPLDKYPWSECYGWVQDKFGLTWQLSVVNEGEQAGITPSMLFTAAQFGRAEEAMKFYAAHFDNSVVKESILYPDGDANAGKLMYAAFQLNGYDMIAMDGPGAHNYTFDEGVSFVVTCDTQEEIDYYWNNFTANGGQESMCGWLKDRFGVSWQIVPSVLGKLMNDPGKAQKVMQAFLQMKKFDIATLEKAAQ